MRNLPVLALLMSVSFILGELALAGSISLAWAGDGDVMPACTGKAGDRPFPDLPAGNVSKQIPIQHVIVLMQENHSFDTYFGKLNKPEFYGNAIDGISDDMSNVGKDSKVVFAHHQSTLCPKDPDHTWNGEHKSWDGGQNDGFARVNGDNALGYYDDTDLPFYYALANSFATADRYFCSALTQTLPNRFFMMTGTAFGHVKNDLPWTSSEFSQKTIFELLNQGGVSWSYYTDSPLSYPNLFRPFFKANHDHMKSLAQMRADFTSDSLPSVSFIDSSFEGEDEHPNGNIQVGQAWVAKITQELMDSPSWLSSVLFLMYDENGGFFDHVNPPPACKPDSIPPMLVKSSVPGAFDRLGFRVPFVAVSPYAKHHYVSHVTYDHTSVLRFIETKFNLPALTARDANADPMMDLFDFDHPNFSVPTLPSGDADPNRSCGKADEDDDDPMDDTMNQLFNASLHGNRWQD